MAVTVEEPEPNLDLPAPQSARPSLDEFLDVMRPRAPGYSDRELRQYWAKNYSDLDPRTLPAWDTFSTEMKQKDPSVQDTDLRSYWEENYGDFGAREKEPDLGRGLKESFQQLPQLGYGLLAGVGAAAESVAGEGGLATGVKEFGARKYQEQGAKIAAESKPSDDITYSFDQASQGNYGALVDWFQHALGYAGGQAVQMLATAGVGYVAGKMGLQAVATNVAERMVAKEVARLTASREAAGLAAEEITKQATANVAGKIGQTVAIGSSAFGMEGGEIFGELASKSVAEKRSLSGAELAKALGASVGAGALEFVGDKVGLDLMVGKVGKMLPGGRATRAGLSGLLGASVEGTTEFAQTLVEEVGQGGDPLGDASIREAINASALGAVGGGAMGGVGGLLSRPDQPMPLQQTATAPSEPAPPPDQEKAKAAPGADVGTFPNAIGLGNPNVGVDEAIQRTWDLLEADTAAQQRTTEEFAQRADLERTLEGMPYPDKRPAFEPPMVTGAIPEPAPLIQPGMAFQPRTEELDPRATIEQERAKLLEQQGGLITPPQTATPPPAPVDAPPQQAVSPAEPPPAPVSAPPAIAEGNFQPGERVTFERNGKTLTGNVKYITGDSVEISVDQIAKPGGVPLLRSEIVKLSNPTLKRLDDPFKAQATPPPAPVEAAPEPTYPSVEDIHKLADAKGIPWDNDPVFMEITKMVTGKSHLDDLTPLERDQFVRALNKMAPQTASAKAKEPEQVSLPAMVEQPRSELPPAQSTEMMLRAQKAEADMQIAGDERGGKYFDQESGAYLGSQKSPTAPWYKELTKGPKPLKREQIEKAIQKIIQDEGVDVGTAVERVKEVLLRDREFDKSPWGEDAEAIMRGETPAWMTAIDERAHEAAPSPKNELPDPSEAQVDAGNYKMGHVRIAGLKISIEHPEGSTRSGTDRSGKPWERTVSSHYGYIRETQGKDKEHIDVFLKPGTAEDYSGPVFVIDQNDPATGRFDEHKSVIGAASMEEAVRMYQANFPANWKGLRSAKQFTMPEFKLWLQMGNKQLPAGTMKPPVPQQSTAREVSRLLGELHAFSMMRGLTAEQKAKAHALADEAERLANTDGGGLTQTQRANIRGNVKKLRGSLDNPLMDLPKDLPKGELISKPIFGGQETTVVPAEEPFALTAQELPKAQEKGPEQLGIDVPPPTIGEAPIIGRDVSPETAVTEAPLFSQQAQTPEPEQAALPTEALDYESLFDEAQAIMRKLPNNIGKAKQEGKLSKNQLQALDRLDEIERIMPNTSKEWKEIYDRRRATSDAQYAENKKTFAAERLKELTDAGYALGEQVEFFAQSMLGPFGGGQTYAGTIIQTPNGHIRVRDKSGKTYDFFKNPWRKVEAQAPEAAPEVTPESGSVNQTASSKVAQYVASRLKDQPTAPGVLAFSSEDLFKRADYEFGGTRAQGTYTDKDAYDALELGINQYLRDDFKETVNDGTFSAEPDQDRVTQVKARAAVKAIREQILDRIPGQKAARTEEQNEFQQFSTPPDLAFVMNWVAKIRSDDVVLEPSAGLGGLAVFAKLHGATVHLNEYSARRAELLKELDLGSVTTENAEQLNNVLPKDVKPTVIVMNPPFSSTAGRKPGERSSRNVLRHLEQALARLQPGGRLVALIGQGRDGKDPQFLEDWKRLTGTRYAYRGRVGLSGKGYIKYGTTYDNQILIYDKVKPDGRVPINANVENVFEAIGPLTEVRHARSLLQPTSVEPRSPAVVAGSEGGARPEPPVSAPTDALGLGGEYPRLETGQPPAVAVPTPTRGERPAREPEQGRGPTLPPGREPEPANLGEQPGSEGRRDAESRPPVEPGVERPALGEELPGRVTVEAADEAPPPPPAENENLVFETYHPKKIKVAGSKPHPGKLVESSAMAAVEPPAATYAPNLPKSVITSGALSLAQLEPIIYAGQAHAQFLPDGSRRGFFDGDGTGVGKGREIAGLIMDNMRQGRKKAVWLSKTSSLVKDAVRDWTGIGGNKDDIFSQGKFDLGDTIARKDGILFGTYHLLGGGLDLSATGNLEAKKDKAGQTKGAQTRFDQLVTWLGKDFDGVLVFDEAHEMRNNMQREGARGAQKPAMKALAGVELQKRFPKARIAYFSATGGIEVSDFGYAERLGMWGAGTPFADKRKFVGAIETGGLAAMEVVAQDLKGNGLYVSRSLAYDDVTYERVIHPLTPPQREIYDDMARGWQTVLQNLNAALEVTGQNKNGNAKSAARSAFWGAQQRFFNQILTALQLPTVLDRVKKDIADGQAVVIQLVNTNEAAQNRQIKEKAQEGAELDDLDLTPRENLLQYLEKAFPTQEFENYTDENGNVRSRPVVDSDGTPVQNAEAVAMKEELLQRLGSLRVPEGPLEMIVNTFGPEAVAEVTGRGKRVVRLTNADGDQQTVIQKRTKNVAMKEAADFQADKRSILVFSDAGGTGQSFHADLSNKNQRRRMHYVVQPGWRADAAMQGLGRTHRTNQKSSPHYLLVSTDLNGHKRFISTIARRLAQLGALTKGQRQTSQGGLFTEKDNLENAYASGALRQFFVDLKNGRLTGFGWEELLGKLGLEGLIDKNGNLQEERIPDVPQFLNRILSLEYEDQNHVFDQFFERMESAVEMAQAAGTLDTGLENYRADVVTLKKEQVVYEDPGTKAKTRLLTFEAKHKVSYHDYKAIQRKAKFSGFSIGEKTGKIYATFTGGFQHTTQEGAVEVQVKLQEPDVDKTRMISDDTFKKNYRKVTGDAAREAWSKTIDEAPQFREETLHLLSGSLLRIWDRLTGGTRVFRVQTEDGKRVVGRVVPEEHLDRTLERLGVSADKQTFPMEKILTALEDGATVELVNGWKLAQRTVAGEDRIELLGDDLYGFRPELTGYGMFVDVRNYKTRFFLPVDRSAEIIGKIIQHRPVLKIQRRGKGDAAALRRTLPEGPALEQIDALNAEMDRREGIANAFEWSPRGEEGVIDAFKQVFGVDVVPVAPTGPEAAGFLGMQYRGTLFVNTDAAKGFVQIAGHELLHQLKRDTPALYRWFSEQATDHLRAGAVPHYTRRLEAAGADLADTDVTEELLADFAGDALADPVFLQRLAADNPTKFRLFLRTVMKWLKEVAQKLTKAGFGSSQYFDDVDATRAALAEVLDAYRSGDVAAIGDVQFSRATLAPTFFSQALRTLEAKMPARASAAQITGILSTGVKPDEVKWTGLDDYLKTKDTFTKAEVIDFVRANQVEVQEVMHGGTPEFTAEQRQRVEALTDALRRRGYTLEENPDETTVTAFLEIAEPGDFLSVRELPLGKTQDIGYELQQLYAQRNDNAGRFASKQLPGGTNYRELLLTLPGKQTPLAYPEPLTELPEGYVVSHDRSQSYGRQYAVLPPGQQHGRPLHDARYPTPETARSGAVNMLNEERNEKAADEWRAKNESNRFTSSHFPEPNVLAHIRFNDRTVDGKKVLFLEEIQSDWHQKGRKAGYRTADITSLPEGFKLTKHNYPDGTSGFHVENQNGATIASGSTEREALLDFQNSVGTDTYTGVPDAPFKKTWHELALRRMLRYAAEHGYDQLAWTTGEQQAERYDLSKQVQSIEWNGLSTKTPTTHVTIHLNSGDFVRFNVDQHMKVEKGTMNRRAEQFIGKDLSDVVGKEVADKIKASYKGELRGEGLKIGGEGMKGFYDTILPLYLNKYGKKWGATVGTLDIATDTKPLLTWMENHGLDTRLEDIYQDIQGDRYRSLKDAMDDVRDRLEGLGREDMLEDLPKEVEQDGVVHAFPITPAMKQSVLTEGQPLFRRELSEAEPFTPSRAKFVGTLTEAQQTALRHVHGTPETWKSKLDTFKTTWKRELVQGLFDQYAPILDYSKKGYTLARMAKGGDGTLEALMLYGKPYVDDDGAYRVEYKENSGMQGFSKVLGALQGEHDRFLEWVAAQRADRLKAVDLEHLYSEADIAALKTLNRGQMPDGTSREKAYLRAMEQLNDWNDAIVKIGADSGLVSEETREHFKNVPYIPFYRLHEDGATPGFGLSPGLVNQYAWKTLKGGTAHLNDDLLANLLQNWSHLITASAKNRAAKETLDAAVRAGVAREVPSGAPGGSPVHYLEGGKAKTFDVTDQGLLEAVAALHYAGLGAIAKPFQAMKRALSFAVTVNPAYKIRNLLRDTVQAIATSDLSYNPAANLAQGFKATALTSETRAQLLAGGGMMRFGSMLDGTNATRTRRLIESGVDPEHILGSANAIQKVWKRYLQPAFDAYQEFGDRGEQINRAALYTQLKAKGMSHQEASFWARDLMDFSMHGKWAAVRILTQVVPFMNARLQGLYKLGRATQADYQRMGLVLGAVSLASIGLLLAYGDDEDWKKREDYDRDNYWWFKIGDLAFRIPKPFEIGAIGTLAERSVEYLTDQEMTGARFAERLSATVFNQLSMNPTPQLLKPVMDLYANKDAFTGKPIETMGMERVRKAERFTEQTSEIARFLGTLHLPDPAQLAMGRWDTLSPVQVDALVRGYFSWLGTAATTVLDYGIRPFVDRGERPNMQLRTVFLAGNFVETLPTGSSRYVSQFYAQAAEIEQAYGSYRAALKRGDIEEAKSLFEDEREKISQYKLVERVKRQESVLNERMKMVEASRSLSGAEKRTLLDQLRDRKHRLAKQVSDRQLVGR